MIVLIGSGNLAEALARAISRTEGATLLQIFARNAKRGTALALENGTAWSSDPRELAAADLYILAVSDAAITTLAESLPIPAEAAVVHTAGGIGIEALPARFDRRGVLYPLQTFTQGRSGGFCQNTSFRRRKRRLLHLGARSVRPQSEPHGISCRLRPSRTPSPGRGFRLQFRQSPLRIGRRDFARDRTALRRTETPDRRNRSQSRRFGRSASGADRACRTRRPADVAAARSRTRSRSATVTNL